ncbi:MAG TPA: hypothetical protein VMF91_22895 [Bryobacteraceae bacterium]|nr:hypothetical protein [Bryobacteraceae bacterium]
MRNLARFAVLVLLVGAGCCACLAQSHTIAAITQPSSADKGVVPLGYPYSISTEPHFAIFVEFPKADSIRRIALGDSNYFLAEADKTDPHYAIIKQIQAPTTKGKPPVETNMLVYMASGRVVDITLKAGKLADTAYSIDYVLPIAPHKVDPEKADPPPISKQELENELRDQERSELTEKMIGEVEKTPKSQPGVTAGGLDLRFYSVKRLGLLALVSFDVENTSSGIIDLEDPQINLVTANDNQKDRKKAPAKVDPVEVIRSIVSPKQLAPGARASCLVEFNPPVHDSDQQVVLSISNRAMADKPARYRLE